MKEKEFHIGDALSVVSGRLLSLRHLEGICDLLSFMTGQDVYTFEEIAQARTECVGSLLEAHPWLGEIDSGDVEIKDARDLERWLEELSAAYPEQIMVSSLPARKAGTLTELAVEAAKRIEKE